MPDALPNIRPARHVRATVSDDGGMLLDLRGRGRWFALSPTAAQWWATLEAGHSADQSAEAVASYYHWIPAEQIHADLASLTNDLLNRGLVTSTLRSRPSRRLPW